jgi:nicotinamide-nucleotide amidase
MFAEILTIGDELTRGEIVDTNSSWLAAQLWDLDVTVRWMTSCRDDADDLVRALRDAAARADLVVCSGGLGPTEDDLTVEVVAELAGVAPVVDEPSRARMAAWLAARDVPVAPIQLRQVRVPDGARVYVNPTGLAPGFEVAIAGVPVMCTPGIPREMQAIFEAGLGPRIAELREARGAPVRIARRIYRVFGRGESQISAACRGVVDGVAGATIHYQVKFPETLVKIVVRDPDGDAARARLEAIDGALRDRLGRHLYGTGDVALPEATTRTLIERGLRVATAESCTGGMIAQLLTAAPGSSAAFVGGAVVYANDEKVRQLGVAAETLAAHGAVSEACAREMAAGARTRFGVELAVAVTGIAGPEGGTPDKPVGTVWLAVDRRGQVTTKQLTWPGPRELVRTLSAWWGLALIREAALADGEPR